MLSWSNNAFKGTFVNRNFHSINGTVIQSKQSLGKNRFFLDSSLNYQKLYALGQCDATRQRGHKITKYDYLNICGKKSVVYFSTYANPLYSTSDLRQIRYTTHPTY